MLAEQVSILISFLLSNFFGGNGMVKLSPLVRWKEEEKDDKLIDDRSRFFWRGKRSQLSVQQLQDDGGGEKNDRSNSTFFLMVMLCNLCSVLANTQKCLRDVAQCRAIIRRFFLFGFPSNLKKIMLHICVVRVCRSVRWFSFQNPEFVKLLLSLNFSYRLDWKTFKRNFPFGQWFGAFIQRKQS